jgi:hypothetical protein
VTVLDKVGLAMIGFQSSILNLHIAANGKRFAAFITAFGVSLFLGACTDQGPMDSSSNQAFAQNAITGDKVDVLWVIDTSGSMSQNQQNVAAQLPNMIAAFNHVGLDYQMAVTTMDMTANGEQGRFLMTGGAAVLTEATPNMSSIISTRVYVGDYDWHPPTTGLEAAQAALSGTNAVAGPNAGFLRPNALLVLIFVTAGNDVSPGSINPNGYQGWLDQIRPNSPLGQKTWVAQMVGISPSDTNCQTSSWQGDAPSTAYIGLANYSGGTAASICNSNLSAAVTSISNNVLELVTAYALNQIPALNSIQVLVNGMAVANNATNGWTYVQATNTVQFHGSAIPKVSDSVVVNFTPGTLN